MAKKAPKIFIALCFLALLLTTAEIVAFFAHTSICTTSGCKLAAGTVRFSDLALLVPAAFVFAILFWLGVIEKNANRSIELFVESGLSEQIDLESRRAKEKLAGFLIDLILSTALAGEGFLQGYLLFRLHKECAFCLVVFCLFLSLAIIRLIQGRDRILAGFASFACVLFLMWLIKPVLPANICLPQHKLVLFYEKGCSHCKKVMNMCRKCRFDVYPLDAQKYAALLKGLAIDEVPVLVVNGKAEKKIIVGQANIEKYLKRLELKKEMKSGKVFSSVSSSVLNKVKELLTPEGAEGGVCKIGESCSQKKEKKNEE